MRGEDGPSALGCEGAACGTRGGAPILKVCPARPPGRGEAGPEMRAPPMADTVTVSCPECDKKIKVPEDALGKKIRCKGCDEVFVAKAPGRQAPAKKAPAKSAAKAPKPAPRKKPADAEREETNPYGVTDESLGH